MDPFPTDVYYLGNVIRVDFLQRYHDMEFIKPLVEDMVQDEPSKRPTMEEVNKRFMEIYHHFPKSKLRSRLVGQRESKDPLLVVQRYIHHYVRTLIHILLRRNPLPIPA
ncbi:hypothetical protein ABKN59_011625 [Abortiporus biennis]